MEKFLLYVKKLQSQDFKQMSFERMRTALNLYSTLCAISVFVFIIELISKNCYNIIFKLTDFYFVKKNSKNLLPFIDNILKKKKK